MTGNLQIDVCYLSATGNVRKNNEDGLLIGDLLVCGRDMDEPACPAVTSGPMLFAAADGMGGHAKGETASRRVLEVLRAQYPAGGRDRRMREALLASKEALDQHVRNDPGSLGLGTTVTGIAVEQDGTFVFNCGDSRVYRMRGGSAERLTKDHSLVQELVDAGVIGEEEMRTHSQKNIITSSIMGDLSGLPPQFYIGRIDLLARDRFLICTDGVWEAMSGPELAECLVRPDLRDAASALYEKAMETGRDNLSFIALDVS